MNSLQVELHGRGPALDLELSRVQAAYGHGSHPTGKGAGVDDIRLVPAARSEKRCPRFEIQSWRSGKAGAPEYRRLRGRRPLGMTSAADIAAPGGTIQRAHERSFLLLSIVSYSNADVPPVVAQSFYVAQEVQV